MVDDYFETCQVSSSVLVHSGYEVGTADDGFVAWQALNTSRHNLLITNHQRRGRQAWSVAASLN
jgi:CheY-like chemotaxis protein